MIKESTSPIQTQQTQVAVEPIWQPQTQQAVFRGLMEAMSRPGSIVDNSHLLTSDTLYRAVLAALLDGDVSLCDANNLLDNGDWPLFQANQAASTTADYILCDGSMAVSVTPKLGTLASPNYSATFIILVAALGQGEHRLQLKGPGVNGSVETKISGLHKSWYQHRAHWNSVFPLGIDMILVDSHNLLALPRTTAVEVQL